MIFKKGDRILAANTGSIVIGDVRIFNPTCDQFIEAGWEVFVPEELDPPPPPVRRYSKLKLIRALGDLWPEYKQMIEMAGFADEFWAANDLAEDDPAFSQFLTLVPDDVKSILDFCLIDGMAPEEPTDDSVLSGIASNDNKYDDTAEDIAKDNSESVL